VKRVELTLHVGPGTFKPVSAERLEDHKMHSEDFVFTRESAETLNACRRAGGRIMAVGTTSLRVMESCVGPDRLFTPKAGSTEIFIHPPMRPTAADMLLTNFHLPKSTLLMLVSAFAGSRENVLAAYAQAVKERLRFFSYGDCMLLK
jgi:S-adenosylmethionine:tRNA ribosyltransferase-isomerase